LPRAKRKNIELLIPTSRPEVSGAKNADHGTADATNKRKYFTAKITKGAKKKD